MMDNIPSMPLISCLCLTRNRVHKLEMALNCFMAQSYPNKELVIVYREDDEATSEYVESLEHKEIVPVAVPAAERLSLGELRNLSLHKARGAYFCQWDDDDWYHCDRLKVQLEQAVRNHYDASVLIHLLMYDETTAGTYLSYYRPWEGSLLCRRDAFNDSVRYPGLNKGEDTEFTNLVLSNHSMYPVIAPHLYIYVYHGGNSWDHPHFERLYVHSQRLSERASRQVGAIVRNELSVPEASALLDAKEFCAEFDYFFYIRNRYLQEKKVR